MPSDPAGENVLAAAPHAVRPRLDSIDLLRGLIMVIMALDHVRDFFTGDTLDPANLTVTFPALFFTRWITHYCAPVFMFLAGTSAFLYGSRGRSKKELSRFLWTRGAWLVVLEATFVQWAWNFNFGYSQITLMVIWALGISMIGLAFLVHLPIRWVGTIGLALIFGHNFFDAVAFPPSDWRYIPWTLLHAPGPIPVTKTFSFYLAYPIVPWIGVMAAGYCFGQLYTIEAARRQRLLVQLGCGLAALFVLLRWPNLYGDAAHWSAQKSPLFSLMSFLNCTKYPPSLLYLLMTLGPAMWLLALFERWPHRALRWLVTIGRVPLFYYLLHLYLIHFAAGITALLFGQPGEARWILGHLFADHRPEGYGYPLWAVYLAWAVIVALLYPPCRWYANLKQRNRSPWLSYL